MVEVGGIEPPSESSLSLVLHVYPVVKIRNQTARRAELTELLVC